MKTKILFSLSLLIAAIGTSEAQVKIGNNPNTINSASLLELESTSMGLLMPRMTLSQKNLITTPVVGLLVFQTDGTAGFYYYDGSAWQLVGPGSGNYWDKTGNDIFNNNSGNVGIGSSTFDATNPEKLLINVGATTSVNAIFAKGSINSYFQTNIKNLSNGTQASSDIVATADNGTETTNFMDVGINGSGYVYQSGNPIETGKANDCYILGSGNDLYFVNNNPTKDMIFLTGGTATTNERVRLTTNGYVGIGTPSPQAYLHVNNSTTGTGSFPLLQLTTGFTGATANDGFTIGLENNTTAYNVQFKTKETGNIEFYGGNNEAMYIKSTGNVGIGFGASTPNSTLQVAGSVSFAIVTQTAATYAVSSTDATVLCNRSSAMTVTLPTAVGISGRIYTVKNINTNTGSSVTINTTSSQTIDSYGTAVGLSYMGNTGFYTSYTFQSNGSNWYILSGH